MEILMRVTMKDIAERCGIGRSTVSFILNGTAANVGLSEELCRRVLQTAKEMGYRRNELASSVRSGKTRVIAYVSGKLSTSYTMRMIAGINDSLNRNGYSLRMYIHDEEESLDLLADKIISNMIPGVIISLTRDLSEQLMQLLKPWNVKVAMTSFLELSEPVVQVSSDDAAGAAAAADKLYEIGHRRLGLVYVEHSPGLKIKQENFLRRLGELGLENGESIRLGLSGNSSWNPEDAAKVAEFCRRPDRPTAFFCEADPLALRFIQYADQAGFRVPDDFSVIGYANLDYTDFSNPPLSTFATPFEEIGEKTTDLLIDTIEHNRQDNVRISIPATYVERMSTKPYNGIKQQETEE